jgi:hypothetical protein
MNLSLNAKFIGKLKPVGDLGVGGVVADAVSKLAFIA